MPTYEYACRSCGSQLEVVQSFTDDALTTCGECGGPLRKVFGAVGISFKGSGFYKTDSRKSSSSSSSTTASSKDEGSSSEGSSSEGSKTKEPASGGGTSGGKGDPAPASTTTKPAATPS